MNKIKIAYLVSSSYSGSTLLSLILNSHPQIGTISEFDNMEIIAKDPGYKCSCGEKIRLCPFFAELKHNLNNCNLPFELDNMDMILKFHKNERFNRLLSGRLPRIQCNFIEEARDKLVDSIPKYKLLKKRYYYRNKLFMEQILSLFNASIFLDATKDPYRMLFLNKKFYTNGIYLFKNGIAGAFSYMKAARIKNNPITIREATSRWFEEQITISRALLRMKPEQYIMVSYSEICQKTEESIYRIYKFLNLDPSESNSHFSEVPHHIIGNAMRLTNATSIKEKTDYIEGLSDKEKDTYREVYKKYSSKLFSINPDIERHLWY